MTTYRKIAPMRMPDVVPGGADMTEPRFERVAPETLLVDESYQRNLSERSVRLIRKMVAGWDWRIFMPPVVIKTPGGYHVIDGQHTAIAAATHPKIKSIPVQLVEADDLADRAKAFLGRNRDRIAVTVNQLHAAGVMARDLKALEINRACKLAGVTILKCQPGMGLYRVGDTMAVSSVAILVKRRGVSEASGILALLVKAKLAPIPASLIKAVEEVFYGELAPELRSGEFKPRPGAITTLLLASGSEIEQAAKITAARLGSPIWKATAHEIYRRLGHGQRRPAAAA